MSLIDLIQIVKTGSPAEVKSAQKQIEKLWNQSCQNKAMRQEFAVFMQEARAFDAIADTYHKASFINTIKWALWFADLDSFSFWSEFLLRQVQSPEGEIRVATVRASTYLLLMVSSNFDHEIPPDKIEKARLAKNCFGHWIMSIKALLAKYNEKRFNRCKYIDALPVGVYKSLQQLHHAQLPSPYFEGIYNEFRNSLNIPRGFNGFGRA